MLTGVLQLLKGNGAGEGKPVSGLTVTQGTDDSDLEEEVGLIVEVMIHGQVLEVFSKYIQEQETMDLLIYWIWSIRERGVKDDTMICDQSTWSDGDTISQNEGDSEKS